MSGSSTGSIAGGMAPDADADHARIRGEQDPAAPRRWLVRAATSIDAAELFG
jgi:hypothetical protein